MAPPAVAACLVVLSLSAGARVASAACEPVGGPPSAAAAAERYFVMLAGRSGVFYDQSGPALSMLVRVSRGHANVEAVGIYADRGRPAFGAVPVAVYRDFMKESARVSDVMLRLEISAEQYERSARVLRTWDRRAREGALLYPDIAMDNILLAKQITESLNQCGELITLYVLDWGLEDSISEGVPPSTIPFKYFKELRRLNQSRHVPDSGFPARHY